MEHMKDFHSIKTGPHQKGFDNLPDGFQKLLAASCQDSQLALEKASRFLLDGE